MSRNNPKVHDYRNHRLRPLHELKRFEALEPGRYLVEGVGEGIELGDRLMFSLKGAEALHLELEVREIRYKIIPQGYWVATLSGEDFQCLLVKKWSIRCDLCQKQTPFEFAVHEGDDEATQQKKASARIKTLGWNQAQADNGALEHLCPECQTSPAH